MTEDQVFDLLRGYLVAIDAEASQLQTNRPTLTDVIRAYPAGPRPEGVYGAMSLVALIDNGEADHADWEDRETGDEERVVETRTRSFEIKVRIDVYGKRSTDVARLFATALRNPRAMVDMPGLAVRAIHDAALTNELKAQLWESHASITVDLAFLGADELLVDVIETGRIDFEGHGGATVEATLPYERT